MPKTVDVEVKPSPELTEQLEAVAAEVSATREELEAMLQQVPTIELPLLNANIEVATFPGSEDGAPTKAIILNYPLGASGLVLGGLGIQIPFAVRFVIPLLEENASELASALTKTGIIIAGAGDVAKLK